MTTRNGTIVVCEDGSNDNHIRALRPDGGTLFVNIQASKGMTFAIWGPWSSLGM